MMMRDFYMRDVNTVAPELLGKLLVHETLEGIASGMIVEVESYAGPDDKGAHSYGNRRTERTEIQYAQEALHIFLQSMGCMTALMLW